MHANTSNDGDSWLYRTIAPVQDYICTAALRQLPVTLPPRCTALSQTRN
jgi:hypothetical protein